MKQLWHTYPCARAGKTKQTTNPDQSKMNKNLFCKSSSEEGSLGWLSTLMWILYKYQAKKTRWFNIYLALLLLSRVKIKANQILSAACSKRARQKWKKKGHDFKLNVILDLENITEVFPNYSRLF